MFRRNNTNKPWYDTILPAIIAAIGVGCLEFGGVEVPNVGDFWAFTQPLFFGLTFWRIEDHMKESKGIKGEAQAFTGAMMLFIAVFSLIWSLGDIYSPFSASVAHDSFQTQLLALKDWHVAAAIAWTGIVTTAITSYGENVAMTRLSAAESTIIYSTEPLWGTAFAAAVLHESIGLNTIIGAGLVITACLWSTIGVSLFSAGAVSSSTAPTVIEELIENMSANLSEMFSGIGQSEL